MSDKFKQPLTASFNKKHNRRVMRAPIKIETYQITICPSVPGPSAQINQETNSKAPSKVDFPLQWMALPGREGGRCR